MSLQDVCHGMCFVLNKKKHWADWKSSPFRADQGRGQDWTSHERAELGSPQREAKCPLCSPDFLPVQSWRMTRKDGTSFSCLPTCKWDLEHMSGTNSTTLAHKPLHTACPESQIPGPVQALKTGFSIFFFVCFDRKVCGITSAFS